MKSWGKVLTIVVVAMMVVSVAAFAAPPRRGSSVSRKSASESEWRTADTHLCSGLRILG